MIYILVGGLVVGSILAYVLFMIFLPEWVGITGKTALTNERSHQGEKVEADGVSKFIGDHDE